MKNGSKHATAHELLSLPGMAAAQQQAVLALASGEVFYGYSFGAPEAAVGELVFHTAMSGYQEILTDPSYAQQLVTFTYPHQGNVGVNPDDAESSRVQVAGCVISELSLVASNWRSQQNLHEYLAAAQRIGIAGIDTRRLTRRLRDLGAVSACIMPGVDAAAALAKAQAFSGLAGQDLTPGVTCMELMPWGQGLHPILQHRSPSADKAVSGDVAAAAGTQDLHTSAQDYSATSARQTASATSARQAAHVIVVDYGVKWQILRYLRETACQVTCVPATTTADAILALQPDAVVLSNGPGDPAACEHAVQQIKQLLAIQTLPILGICLGFQLLALASGASTFKMKFGHHGANHPVLDTRTGRVFISSQNHGFAVEESSLPEHLEVTQRSLFDQTIQGFQDRLRPVLALQGHPEASPGPTDMNEIFKRFMGMIAHAKTS